MGQRRIRDLLKRQNMEIRLFDANPERLCVVSEKFGIEKFSDIENALKWQPDVFIISTPPDKHDEYIELALQNNIQHFCEENIWTYDYCKVERISSEKKLISAPSCSFHFLPIIKKMKEIIDSNKLGALHYYHHILSTYMLSWHPEEGNEYYARLRDTAAGREMVPFELVFLNYLFGLPEKVNGIVKRLGNLPNNWEDTRSLQIELESGAIGMLTVSQGALPEVRQGAAVFEKGVINFDILSGKLTVNYTEDKSLTELFQCGTIREVLEETYSEEINTFIDCIKGKAVWPHSYFYSAVATAALAGCEYSSSKGQQILVEPTTQPERNL